MAMGDKIDCPVGGVVETTLQLDFKKAQVSQLNDAPKFRFVTFSLHEPAKNIEDQVRVKPASIEVTQDDQKVTVRYSFDNDKAREGSERFVAGVEWKLMMAYASGESSPLAEAADRRFTLGTVRLTKP